ncbi:lipid kinase YegS [Phytohalomonas tamaricis]|uniref:lipid kinase YegS n=1 Tax=Phytohalomonas tamaricis TaxID=2081032 RepID=UPI0021D43DD2|nr:lipid kinase YegS [Phytohalomonas tamaricis]
MTIRLILNGKSAGEPEVREAVKCIRHGDVDLEVRVTWEDGDVIRFIEETHGSGIERIVVGGGDGTVHEAVNGLLKLDPERRPTLGIIPLGTANDFARSAGIPLDPGEALQLAISGEAHCVDVGCLNGIAFLNMASGGFGAKVTASTPSGLKKLLGGGAYSLVGAMHAWRFQPFSGRLELTDIKQSCSLIVLAIGNGRQAGGGQELTPHAKINDGLLDVMVVEAFSLADIGQAVRELDRLEGQGRFVRYFQVPWVNFESDKPLPINLDGEEHEFEHIHIECIPGAISLVLPSPCDLLS